jgi:hypothetical protein
VIIVPGIMGSELRDVEQDRTIWGFRDLDWYVRAWTTGSGIQDLKLTDAESGGDYGRVRPVGLLRFPGFARYFRGMDPYGPLVKSMRHWVMHDTAVRPFPYDWRLPVSHNARLLAEFTNRCLAEWRRHEAHDMARRTLGKEMPARVVFVAHSMGGLLVRRVCRDYAPIEDIRTVVTLGTPFVGAVKAVEILNTGRMPGIPLPSDGPLLRALQARSDLGVRALVETMPGVHDLLPRYRCVVDGDGARLLTAADVASLGGNRDLAAESFSRAAELDDTALPGHIAVAGIAQPTSQSLHLRHGVAEPVRRMFAGLDAGDDRTGDGTVYYDGATLPLSKIEPVAVQHTNLPTAAQAQLAIEVAVTETDTGHHGPPMGDEVGVGLALPDLAAPTEPFRVSVSGAANSRRLRGLVRLLTSGSHEKQLHFDERDGACEAEVVLHRPGLYRVSVSGHGGPEVSQLLLVGDPSMAAP